MKEKLTFHKDLVGFILIALFIFLFLNLNDSSTNIVLSLPTQIVTIMSIFFSIVIKAIPFVLAGAIVAVFIQRLLAKASHNYPKLTLLLSTIECSSLTNQNRIASLKNMFQQGVPIYVVIPLLLGAPFLNPVVVVGTYYVFINTPHILIARIGLSVLLILFVMLMVYLLFQDHKQSSLTSMKYEVMKPMRIIQEISDEFFELGRTLFLGAFIISTVRVILSEELANLASNELWSSALLMVMAFILSLNPITDAFIASSFENTLPVSSLVAFMVFGSLFNVRIVAMLLQVFHLRYVMYVSGITFIGVLCLVVLL